MTLRNISLNLELGQIILVGQNNILIMALYSYYNIYTYYMFNIVIIVFYFFKYGLKAVLANMRNNDDVNSFKLEVPDVK